MPWAKGLANLLYTIYHMRYAMCSLPTCMTLLQKDPKQLETFRKKRGQPKRLYANFYFAVSIPQLRGGERAVLPVFLVLVTMVIHSGLATK